MLDGFLEIIRNIGIFIVCAQAVIHFRPRASYEKYLKVLVSIIVLVMLIIPCFQVLGDVESFLYSMNQYEKFFSGENQAVWKEQSIVIGEDRQRGVGEENVDIGLDYEMEPIVIEPVEVIE